MSDYTPGTGLPLGLPLGSRALSRSTQVSATLGEPRGTNTAPTPSPESARRKRRRVDADALRRIADAMPQRDREVLERVSEHRYLTTHQIQRFVFTNHATDASAARTTRYVVQRLEKLALIRPMQRRIGGVRAGSAARVWQLAPAGARLIRDDGAWHRTHEPSARFLGHCLAVADTHLALRSLVKFDHVDGVRVETEPAAWRRYSGPSGEPRWLRPDLGAVVATADYEDRWFIEVDLGSESVPTLLRKCGQYEAYRASGMEQHEHGVFPLVLWLFTQAERAERLRESIARSSRMTPQLYRYATVGTFMTVMQEPSS